ncbi:MAG: caspase family protein [Planctomycetes bacterium]|nr:caspase family protein [Planctomycetota bacterium]
MRMPKVRGWQTGMPALPIILSALLILAFAAHAEDAPKAYALVVAGEGDEANFTENYRDWTARLHKILTKDCGIPAAQVTVLAEKKELLPNVANDTSKKENVLKAFKDLAEKVKPGDQVLVFFIGHGTEQEKTAKLCLPGPDLSSDETAEFLNSLKTREVALIHSACGSDGFLDKCSLPGRVLIMATNSANEGNEAYFMEFFLQAYENKAAGDEDKDGAVDLLEAFSYAATQCPKWYSRQYLEKTGWRTEGKQSRALWKKFYGKVEDKKEVPPENPDADDAEPQFGEWGPHWEARRMVTEHAQLDDNGDKLGTALFADNAFTPLNISKEELDGCCAAQLKPGKPRGDKRPPAKPLEASK